MPCRSACVGGSHRLLKRLGSFTRRQVLRKARVVGTAMPPVPEDGDRHTRGVCNEAAVSSTPGERPRFHIQSPVSRTQAGTQSAPQSTFCHPPLLPGPVTIMLGGREPVAAKQTSRGPSMPVRRTRHRKSGGNGPPRVELSTAITKRGEVFASGRRVVGGQHQAGTRGRIERQTLQR